jgi:hypothetical protein
MEWSTDLGTTAAESSSASLSSDEDPYPRPRSTTAGAADAFFSAAGALLAGATAAAGGFTGFRASGSAIIGAFPSKKPGGSTVCLGSGAGALGSTAAFGCFASAEGCLASAGGAEETDRAAFSALICH